MVFQLPFTDFPAEAPPGKMAIYDHARPYLHSRQLRWSWAAMSGRTGGEWSRRVARTPVPEMIRQLTDAGFSGLWVDLNGYDVNNSPEKALTNFLRSEPVRGRQGQILFYTLPMSSGGNRTERAVLALNPVEVTFPLGFYAEEFDQGERWRWSNQNGSIRLRNPLTRTRRVVVRMALQTGYPEPQVVRLSAGGTTETMSVGVQKQVFERALTLEPNGEQTLLFTCDCRRVAAPADPRGLYFRMHDFQVTE
jgi:phosphoglycerol transferase